MPVCLDRSHLGATSPPRPFCTPRGMPSLSSAQMTFQAVAQGRNSSTECATPFPSQIRSLIKACVLSMNFANLTFFRTIRRKQLQPYVGSSMSLETEGLRTKRATFGLWEEPTMLSILPGNSELINSSVDQLNSSILHGACTGDTSKTFGHISPEAFCHSKRYRIGPFEVESALIEHPAVVESAVVSSPDPLRGEVT